MNTYWNTDKAGGLPGYLGHRYPRRHIAQFGDECVVKMSIVNGAILLYDRPGPGGKPFASRILPVDEPLRKVVYDMVELHAENWGIE